MAPENNQLSEKLKSLFDTTKKKTVTADAVPFEELPDGYYSVEVMEVKMAPTKNGDHFQLAWKLKVTEGPCKNRYIFKYQSLADERGLLQAKSDLLKFEEKENEPVIPLEALESMDTFTDSLGLIVSLSIYVRLESSQPDKEGKTRQWSNFVSWKQIADMEEKGISF